MKIKVEKLEQGLEFHKKENATKLEVIDNL